MSRAQRTRTESADIIGAACKELLDKGHRTAVAISNPHPAGDPRDQHTVFAESEIMAEIRFEARKLGNRRVEQFHYFALIDIGARSQIYPR